MLDREHAIRKELVRGWPCIRLSALRQHRHRGDQRGHRLLSRHQVEREQPAGYGEPAYGNSFRMDEDPYICQTCRICGRECSFSEPAPLPGDPTMS